MREDTRRRRTGGWVTLQNRGNWKRTRPTQTQTTPAALIHASTQSNHPPIQPVIHSFIHSNKQFSSPVHSFVPLRVQSFLR